MTEPIEDFRRLEWYRDLAEDCTRMYNMLELKEELDTEVKVYIEKLKERWRKLLDAPGCTPVYNEDYAVVIFENIQYIYDNLDNEIAGEMETGNKNTKGRKFNPVFYLIPTVRRLLEHNLEIIIDKDWISGNPHKWDSSAPDMFGISINAEMANVLLYEIILEPFWENNKRDEISFEDILPKEADGAVLKMGLMTVDKDSIVTFHCERIK